MRTYVVLGTQCFPFVGDINMSLEFNQFASKIDAFTSENAESIQKEHGLRIDVLSLSPSKVATRNWIKNRMPTIQIPKPLFQHGGALWDQSSYIVVCFGPNVLDSVFQTIRKSKEMEDSYTLGIQTY